MNIKHYLFACLSLLALTACSEADDTVEEYADWQNRNEAYFSDAYNSAQSGDKTYWDTFRSYTKSDDSQTTTLTDYIVVEKLASDFTVTGSTTECPHYSDSVSIHYRGYLIPSTTYKSGYQFDSSYQGTFNDNTARPYTFCAANLVDGFSTALQHMHRGDRWLVTIPHQLGYGSTDNGDIPSYSTLIFEIRLVDFWNLKKGDRE